MVAELPGLGPEYAARCQDGVIAAAYPMRPPYPDETFAVPRGVLMARERGVNRPMPDRSRSACQSGRYLRVSRHSW